MPDRIPFYGLIDMYMKGISYPKIDTVYVDKNSGIIEQAGHDITQLLFSMGVSSSDLPLPMTVKEFGLHIAKAIFNKSISIDESVAGMYENLPVFNSGHEYLYRQIVEPLLKRSSKITYGNLDEYNGINDFFTVDVASPSNEFEIVGTTPVAQGSGGWLYFPGFFPNAWGFYMTYYAGHSFYVPDGWDIDDQWTNKRWENDSNFRYRYVVISHQNIADYPVPGYRNVAAFVKYAFPCLPFLAYVKDNPGWVKKYKPPFDYDIKRDGQVHYIDKGFGKMTIFDWVDYAHDSGLKHPSQIARRL